VRGHGFVEEGLEGLETEIEDPVGLLLGGGDVADGVLVEAGAGVELVFDVVLKVAGGLVDADGRVVHDNVFGEGFGGWLHKGRGGLRERAEGGRFRKRRVPLSPSRSLWLRARWRGFCRRTSRCGRHT